METTIERTHQAEQRIGQLKAILYLLQTNLEEFKDEVERSYELLKVGEKTDLSKKIENSLDNPFEEVFAMSAKLDDQVKFVVDRIVKGFLQNNQQIISTAYKSATPQNDLHYSIVLKNDTIENRNTVFEFFDKFDQLDISQKMPVYFQFTPQRLADKIISKEEISLN